MRQALRIFNAILVAAVVVAGTTVGVLYLDRAIRSRMTELRDRTLAAIEQAVGRRITYGSLSPSILQRIDISDLEIHARDDPARVVLAIHNLQVHFNLLRILGGGDPISALQEVRIVNSRLRFDFAADRDLADLAQQALKAGEGGQGLQARLTGSGVDLELLLPGTTLEATGLSFSVGGEDGGLGVSLQGSIGARLAAGPRVSTALRAQGRVARDLSWSDLLLQVSGVSSSWLSAGRQTFQLSWQRPRLEIRKIQDRQPVDLLVTADLDQGLLEASLTADGMRLDQLVSIEAGIVPDGRLLALPFSGWARASWRLREGGLAYEAELAADLPDELPVAGVRFTTRLHGDQNRLVFDRLILAAPRGTAEFDGDVLLASLLPEGRLSVSDFPLPNGGVANAVIDVQRRDGSLWLGGRKISLGDVGLDSIDATLALRTDVVRFQLRTFLAPALAPATGGPAAPSAGPVAGAADAADAVEVSGELRLAGSRALTLRGSLRQLQPELLYRLAAGTGVANLGVPGLERLLAPLTVTADFDLSTDFHSLAATSPKVTIASSEEGGIALSTGLALSRETLALSNLAGSLQGVPFSGNISARTDRGALAFDADTRIMGQPYALSGSWSETAGLSVRGSGGLEVAMARAGGAWRLSAKGEGLPIPLGGRMWHPTFDLYGVASSVDSWQVAGTVALGNLPVGRLAPAGIECDLNAQPRRVEFSRLKYIDPFSTLEGSGSLALDPSGATFPSAILSGLAASFSFSVRGARTAEAYAVSGSWHDGSLSAVATVTSAPLERLGSFAVKGALSGSARISGTLSHPSAQCELALVDGQLGSDPLTAQARFTYSGSRLEVADLSGRYLDHRLTGISGSVDLGTFDFRLHGAYQGELFGDQVDVAADLSGSAGTSGPQELAARFFHVPFSGRLALDAIRVAGVSYPGFAVAMRTGDGLLHFDGGPQNGLHGTLDSSMAFSLEAVAPLPIRGTARGTLRGDQLEARVDVDDFDLRVTNNLLKNDVYKVTSGRAWGQLVLSGPLNDPDFTGTVRVRDGMMTLRYTPDRIGPVSGVLTFDQRVLTSEPFTASAGAARLAGTASFRFDHWVPVSFGVKVSTLGEPGAHFVYQFGRVVVDAYATGAVQVSGDDRRTDVTGTLVATSARVTLGPQEPGPTEPEQVPTFVTMNVETGKRVEFTWPSEAFPVVRTTAAAGGKLAVSWRGDTGSYSVVGAVDVHGGDIFYFDRSFVLKSGTITFNEDEHAFDPRVLVHGEIREYDPRDGKQMRIYLDADGSLNELSPRFSTDTTLPQSEVLALLGAPITERIGGQGVLSSAVMLSSDLLSTFGLLRPFEARVRDALGLDVFSIRTQILQNLIAQKLFNTPGLSPLDNTSLSLGKYLGNDLFLELLVGLQAPRGPSGLLVPGAGLQSDLEVTLQWDTPFFLLEWSFQPRHPDALFLTDNSLGLSWRYSW